MDIVYWYWGVIQIPLNWFAVQANIDIPSVIVILYKVIVTFILVTVLYRLILNTFTRIKLMIRGDSLLDSSDLRANAAAMPGFNSNLQAAQNLEGTVRLLKKAKAYDSVAEAYASANKFKDAAKWYKKAKNPQLSAMMLAKSGNTVGAAKLLRKIGDFETAARFFSEKGKHLDAARAYEKAGKLASAGAAYALARKPAEAVTSFKEYFAHASDPFDTQLAAAESCLKLLNDEGAQGSLNGDSRKTLLPFVAQRFEHAKRYESAAALYRESGELARAGEVYVLAGKFQEAAQCMKQAGKDKEASLIAGRFYESKQQWREAALAYAAAGEYLRAGDCYARASDPMRSAECYERANEFYRAGLAYAHASAYPDAIRALQKVFESDKNFDQSRALLGRCFYEMHDYEHCAAALDNHLTGKRVESNNKEYFYMLALAYEQLGKLDESRELLYKLRTLDIGYKDVSQRISSISSRISMRASAVQAPGSMPPPDSAYVSGGANDATRSMNVVENSLEGRYKLERELGRGGMGVVFLARDKSLDRQVALKFLGDLIDNSDEFRQRFIREAKAAAKINHPNIISIYDISATSGKAYIAMEFVDGVSLSRYLSMKQKLTPREAVNIINQACSALAAIHEAGIVHRDIKPDNILIAKAGLVKLTDFGLAKSGDNRLTRSGTSMGTPSYMSPEQVLGKEADARSDIYSMGLVLHELLTGKTVFREGDVLERQLQEMPPPPSAAVEGVPAELDAIILKCVQKKPDERFGSTREFLEELRKVKTS